MAKRRLFLFNGPPRCGKDTSTRLALDLIEQHNHLVFTKHEKFSAPNKAAFASLVNAPYKNFIVSGYEERKEEIIPWLGVSFRQWQIDFSEKFMKPLYGEDIFARLLIERLVNDPMIPDVVLISDCGFQTEVDYLAKTLGASGQWHITLVCLVRDGCSFAGDSRSRVQPTPGIDKFTLLHNDGPESSLRQSLKELVLP